MQTKVHWFMLLVLCCGCSDPQEEYDAAVATLEAEERRLEDMVSGSVIENAYSEQLAKQKFPGKDIVDDDYYAYMQKTLTQGTPERQQLMKLVKQDKEWQEWNKQRKRVDRAKERVEQAEKQLE